MERPREEKGKVRYSIEGRVTTQTLHSITGNCPGSLPVLGPGWALRSGPARLLLAPNEGVQ